MSMVLFPASLTLFVLGRLLRVLINGVRASLQVRTDVASQFCQPRVGGMSTSYCIFDGSISRFRNIVGSRDLFDVTLTTVPA